jgi:hypothetical protein
LEYCRALKFDEDPNYEKLIGLFESVAQKNNFNLADKNYYWVTNKTQLDKQKLKAEMLASLKKK